MKETIFKVGDKVWDMSISNEPGEVVDINDKDYPISVCFPKKDLKYIYTLDGRFLPNYPKTLSLTPYTFKGFSQQRPKKEPEIGSFCLFSDTIYDFNNNIGIADILREVVFYKDNVGFRCVNYITDKGNYKYCKQIEIKEV